MKLLFCDTQNLHRTMERRRSSSMWLAAILSIVLALEDCVYSSSQAEIERHLELGRDMLARGQFQDALSHYHAAVDSDPNNYLTYFKRATVYLALGKAKFALSDLNRVLELKPDFTAARMQTAQVLLKQGDLDAADRAFRAVLEVQAGNVEAVQGIERIIPLRQDLMAAQGYFASQNYDQAIEMITAIIESIPWDLTLREMRAKARLASGDTRGAMADIRSVTRLGTDNTEGFLLLARLHYDMGEATESLREIRECLRLDADHKECFAHYKIVKKVAKALEDMMAAVQAKDYAECVNSGNKVLKLEEKVPMIRFEAYDNLCRCNRHTNQLTDSLSSCNSALAIQKLAHIFCDRAETFIESEMYEDAVHDYHAALELDEGYQRAREGLERAKKMQKQSERRDYYKILGVNRQSTKKEIVKAYRKAAQQWHPDNFQGDEKKLAEKKFIDIAAAKEVLTDPEKRQKFDQGEDPLDPEQQRQQGFNPFHQFHNSPFQFKFHFN